MDYATRADLHHHLYDGPLGLRRFSNLFHRYLSVPQLHYTELQDERGCHFGWYYYTLCTIWIPILDINPRTDRCSRSEQGVQCSGNHIDNDPDGYHGYLYRSLEGPPRQFGARKRRAARQNERGTDRLDQG